MIIEDETPIKVKEKEVAIIRNLLIVNVGPEGHDPTTFGL